jgi:hypothetical protein
MDCFASLAMTGIGLQFMSENFVVRRGIIDAGAGLELHPALIGLK